MSSLASLAHHATAQHPVPPALTSSQIAFYATAATVIPVLFFALAVQGDTYNRMLRPDTDGAPGPLVGLASLILVAGAGGEGIAMFALFQGSDTPQLRSLAFAALIILLLAVVARPFMAGVKAMSGDGSGSDPGGAPNTTTERGEPNPEAGQNGTPV